MGTAGLRKSGRGWLGFEVVDGVACRWVNMAEILGVLVGAELSGLARGVVFLGFGWDFG